MCHLFWGAITTNASGNAVFRFRSNPNGIDDQPMPWDFPTLAIGHTVHQVGQDLITLAECDHGGWTGGDDDSSDDSSGDEDSGSDDNDSSDD